VAHRPIVSENDRKTIGTAAARLVTREIAVPTIAERFPDDLKSTWSVHPLAAGSTQED